MVRSFASILAAASMTVAAAPAHADPAHRFLQTDNLGMNVVTYNATAGTTSTIADQQVLSEFVGLHYFIRSRVRIGMNLQFSEVLAPPPAAERSRFWTFAFLPQVGWHFWGPFTAAFILTVAPWSRGESRFLFGVQGLLGVAIPVGHGVNITAALEVPVNFYPEVTVGFTPLAGVSIRL